jgi:hypothetical protein
MLMMQFMGVMGITLMATGFGYVYPDACLLYSVILP